MTGITIYGKQDCPACAEAKAFFAGKSIPVKEVDIEQAPKSVFDMFPESDMMEIPVIEVCSKEKCETIIGFDENRVIKAIE